MPIKRMFKISTDILLSEKGTVIVIFAICAFLIAMLGIGFSIQRPTEDANVTKIQHAITIAASEAMYNLSNPGESVNIAANTVDAISSNTYVPDQKGFLNNKIENLFLWIPRPGNNNYRVYNCNGTSCLPCPEGGTQCSGIDLYDQLSIVNNVFDVDGVDEYYNGIFVYGKATPYNFMGVFEDKQQEMAATAVYKTQLNYILVDPAFSMYSPNGFMQENYAFMFGTESVNPSLNQREVGVWSDVQWPLAVNRETAFHKVGEAWEYPSQYGLMQSKPVNGGTFNNYELYHFLASLCFNLPWDYYKSAVVDLLDYLAIHSSFNSTTMLGLTGPGPVITADPNSYPPEFCPGGDINSPLCEHPDKDVLYKQNGTTRTIDTPIITNKSNFPDLIPIVPSTTEGGKSYSVSQTTFPFSETLQTRKSSAYYGFFSRNNVDADAMWGADGVAQGKLGYADDIGSSHNMWEMCMCRGLIMDSSSPYSLTDDKIGVNIADSLIPNYIAPSERTRASGSLNWCSDSSDDNLVGLEASQSGKGGESARNLISSMAPRLRYINNIIAQTQSLDTNATWIRPNPPTVTTYSPAIYGPLSTGWRYLPDSITAACNVISNAELNYDSQGGDYYQKRKIDEKSRNLVVFGFGAWSPIALEYLRRTHGPASFSNEQTEQLILEQLYNAVSECACNKGVRVILALLPLNEYDRHTALEAQNKLGGLFIQENKDCEGQNSSQSSSSSSSVSNISCSGALNMFVIDYQNSFFFEQGTGSDTTLSEHSKRKLNAAKYFRENMPTVIRKMLQQHIFSL